MTLMNKIMGVKEITGDIERDVADINSDKKISAVDYMYIMNDIMDAKKLDIR